MERNKEVITDPRCLEYLNPWTISPKDIGSRKKRIIDYLRKNK